MNDIIQMHVFLEARCTASHKVQPVWLLEKLVLALGDLELCSPALDTVVERSERTTFLFSHHFLPLWPLWRGLWLWKRRMAVAFYIGTCAAGVNAHMMNLLIFIATDTAALYVLVNRCVLYGIGQ